MFLLFLQGFPCNQFARQEPAANATELYFGMAWVRPGLQRGYNFYPFFPLTKKIEVNGKKSHPIFNYLKVRIKIMFKGRFFWGKISLIRIWLFLLCRMYVQHHGKNFGHHKVTFGSQNMVLM